MGVAASPCEIAEEEHLAAQLANARQQLAAMEQRAIAAEQALNAHLVQQRSESDRCASLEAEIRAVEKLGMKLISGKKHWKLEYGNVRMPMSKTPSDWRANLNSSADMANRCF